MAGTAIIEILCRFIADVCALDPASVLPNGRLLGFGLDSVRLVDLLLAVEAHFGLELSESDPELASVETVSDLAALIERRANGGGRA